MTTTLPIQTCFDAGGLSTSVLMADGDPEEHLLMSAFASRWTPELEFTFARDGGDLLLQLAFIDSVDALPNAIVLNYHMSRRSGFQALCELQAHPVLWQIPVIVVADNFRSDEEAASYRAGARWFQRKPHTLEEMHELVDRIEDLAADPYTYQSCGSIDLSLFNADFAASVEDLFSRGNLHTKDW